MSEDKNFSQAPEKDASSPPLQLFSVIVPLLMVRREAAGEGVRGLEGADNPLPLLLGSALQGATSLLFSWDVLIICAQHALPQESNQQLHTHLKMTRCMQIFCSIKKHPHPHVALG
jgi:hypothetical protein